MTMATELGRVVTYYKALPSIKLQDPGKSILLRIFHHSLHWVHVTWIGLLSLNSKWFPRGYFYFEISFVLPWITLEKIIMEELSAHVESCLPATKSIMSSLPKDAELDKVELEYFFYCSIDVVNGCFLISNPHKYHTWLLVLTLKLGSKLNKLCKRMLERILYI